MPAGLQVLSATGDVIVDTSTQMGRIFGSVVVASGASGSLTNSNFSTGIPFAIPIVQFSSSDWDPSQSDPGVSWPSITFSGNTMSWASFNTSLTPKPTFTIYYGAR